MNILANMLIYFNSPNGEAQILRVLYVDNCAKKYIVIKINQSKTKKGNKKIYVGSWPYELTFGQMRKILNSGQILPHDPIQRRINSQVNFSSLEIDKRDSAYDVISPLLFDEEGKVRTNLFSQQERNKLINQRAKILQEDEKPVHEKTIRKYLKRYWVFGQSKDALLPHYSHCGRTGVNEGEPNEQEKLGEPLKQAVPLKKWGRKRCYSLDHDVGINITPGIINIFKAQLAKHYKGRETLTDVYEIILRENFSSGEDEYGNPMLLPEDLLPTITQFRYHYNKLVEEDPEKWLRIRHGDIVYDQNYRAADGSSTKMAFGPGDIYQIDPVYSGIYCVNSIDRFAFENQVIIYPVADQFAHVFAGFSLGFQKTSMEFFYALQNAFEDKVEYCRRLAGCRRGEGRRLIN